MSHTDTSTWEVILVEDQSDIAEVVARILRHHHILVHTAETAGTCLDMLNTVKPTLIVTDLAMPGMDGWEMLKEIRSRQGTSNIPVVAITAYHSPEVADTAIRVGFDGYFPKPVEAGTFVAKLVDMFAGT